MTRSQIPFLGGSSKSRSAYYNNQLTLNMYPVISTAGDAKSQLALHCTPGPRNIGTGGGKTRSNGLNWGEKLYSITGNNVTSIDTSENIATIGTAGTITGIGRAKLTGGLAYFMIIADGKGWFSDGSTITQITDPDFPSNPTACTHVSGYFVVNNGGTDEVYVSAVDDPSSWSSLERTNAEADRDNVVGLASTTDELVMIGDKTTEIYYLSTNLSFPFQRYDGGVIDWGTISPDTIFDSSYGVFFLSINDEGDVVPALIKGGQYVDLGNDDVNWEINQQSDITTAIAFVKRQAGRVFYEITFSGLTKVLDIKSGLWHDLKSFQQDRHRINGYGSLLGKGYGGDWNNSNLYHLDFATHTDDGNTLIRKRRGQIIHKENRQLTFDEVIVDVEKGTGIDDDPDTEPQLILQYADDGDPVLSTEYKKGFGKKANKRKRLRWKKGGKSRHREYELTMYAAADLTITDMYANVRVGKR